MGKITFRRALGYFTMIGMLTLGTLVLMGFGVFRGVLLYSQRTIHHGKEEEA